MTCRERYLRLQVRRWMRLKRDFYLLMKAFDGWKKIGAGR